MPRPSRREHLIDTAIELFYKYGFHATSVDKVLEKAGVSKKTMYQHFKSKEELLYAALKRHDGVFRNNFMKGVENTASSPEEKALAIFDVAESWFNDNNFFGCMFINAVGEHSELDSPVRDISKQFKQLMWNYVADLTKQIDTQSYKKLADEICLLLEGAIVTAQVSNNPQASKIAKRIAQTLLENK